MREIVIRREGGRQLARDSTAGEFDWIELCQFAKNPSERHSLSFAFQTQVPETSARMNTEFWKCVGLCYSVFARSLIVDD